MQIRVKIQGISEADKVKFKKIFHLSISRKLQYVLAEENADIIINANPRYQHDGSIPILTIGKPENFPSSTAHIKPPLLGIRVLKALDAVQLTQSKAILSEKVVETPVLDTPVADTPLPEVETEVANAKAEDTIAKAEYTNAKAEDTTYNVLIVDDSVLIHKALEIELQSAEFGTHNSYAESGEQCLDFIKEKKFDLIFLDVMMPGIDGFETCTQIRKNQLYKKTPVIMLSSKTSPLDEVKGVMAGCTTYLTKPIKHEDFQKLLIRMDKWLENFNPTK